MATTTATITLTSADISSDALSLTKTATLYKADTTTGLDQTSGFSKDILTATTNIVLLDSTALGVDKAGKVYIANKSTESTEYVIITINAQIIGRLYAGDWMFIPWSQSDAAGNIELQPSVATSMPIEYMLIHEGKTQTSA
tara:strand:- start:85 stop:507 length:423 start_codon:yes stop_codon:yes gene_type:complete